MHVHRLWAQVLDGDLIEELLQLGERDVERVATLVGVPAGELTKRVEDIARLH